jgi:hypothetical protein
MLLYFQNVPGEAPEGGGGAAADGAASPEAGANDPAAAAAEAEQGAADGAPVADPNAPAGAPADGTETPEEGETAEEAVQGLAETIEGMGLTELFESIAGDLIKAIQDFIDLLKEAFPGIEDGSDDMALSEDALQGLILGYTNEINNSTNKSPLILSFLSADILGRPNDRSRGALTTALRNSGITRIAVVNSPDFPSIDGMQFVHLALPTSTTPPTELEATQESALISMITAPSDLLINNAGPDGLVLESIFKLLKNPDVANATSLDEATLRAKLTELGYTGDQISTISNHIAFVNLVVNDPEIKAAAMQNFHSPTIT